MSIFHWICKITRSRGILSSALFASILLSGCSGLKITPAEEPEEPISVITGKPGGIKIADFGSKDSSSENSLPVNALLWRAALDIASFVPLDDVDTFGGSIVTEWYQPVKNPDNRLKLTIFVVGLELRSDAINVHAYTQKKAGTDWIDSGRDEILANKLEGLILSRARELRSASLTESIQ